MSRGSLQVLRIPKAFELFQRFLTSLGASELMAFFMAADMYEDEVPDNGPDPLLVNRKI